MFILSYSAFPYHLTTTPVQFLPPITQNTPSQKVSDLSLSSRNPGILTSSWHCRKFNKTFCGNRAKPYLLRCSIYLGRLLVLLTDIILMGCSGAITGDWPAQHTWAMQRLSSSS